MEAKELTAVRLARTLRKRPGDPAIRAELLSTGLAAEAMRAAVHYGDTQYWCSRALCSVEHGRPYKPAEATAEAEQAALIAASLLATEPDIPEHPLRGKMSREEREAAYTDYQSGGWRDYYRSVAVARREAAISRTQARKYEMHARVMRSVARDPLRSYLEELADETASALSCASLVHEVFGAARDDAAIDEARSRILSAQTADEGRAVVREIVARIGDDLGFRPTAMSPRRYIAVTTDRHAAAAAAAALARR